MSPAIAVTYADIEGAPRTGGDEPHVVTPYLYGSAVLPAQAGMSPCWSAPTTGSGGAPRTGGDEPSLALR